MHLLLNCLWSVVGGGQDHSAMCSNKRRWPVHSVCFETKQLIDGYRLSFTILFTVCFFLWTLLMRGIRILLNVLNNMSPLTSYSPGIPLWSFPLGLIEQSRRRGFIQTKFGRRQSFRTLPEGQSSQSWPTICVDFCGHSKSRGAISFRSFFSIRRRFVLSIYIRGVYLCFNISPHWSQTLF